MQEITLSQGYIALVDDTEYERSIQSMWRPRVAHRKDGSVMSIYAQRHDFPAYLHRFILGVTDPKVHVDHIDHNGLNCQRANLRIATNAQNHQNMRLSISSASGYKGVTWHSYAQRWMAQICIAGKRVCLGYFVDPIEAAKVYDAAAIFHFGEFACLNFPSLK
jgi:hypothetical protein